MSDQLPSKDEVSIREVIAELKHDLGSADAGPWEIYTSNSYRRVGLAGTYKPVVYPTVHADGQPDIAGFQNLRAMVESFNAAPRLIAEIERLNTELSEVRALLRISDRMIESEWFQRTTYKQQARAAQDKLETCGLQCSATMKSLLAENDRLRACLSSVAGCGTCEACRGAALRALGERHG